MFLGLLQAFGLSVQLISALDDFFVELAMHFQMLQMYRDPRQQLLFNDGFAEVVAGAGSKTGEQVLGAGTRAKQNDRQLLGGVFLADLPAGVVAGQARHHHVQDHQVHITLFHFRQRLHPIGHLGNAKVVQGQQVIEHLQIYRLVIDDQNMRALAVERRPNRLDARALLCLARRSIKCCGRGLLQGGDGCRRRSLSAGQRKRKGRALPRFGRYANGTAVQLHQFARNRQAQPAAPVSSLDRALPLLEGFKDCLELIRWYADTGIAD